MPMELNLSIDQNDLLDRVADKLAERYAAKLNEAADVALLADKLMTPEQICEKVLNCSRGTLDDYYMQQPGFPYTYKGKRLMYMPSEVHKWLKNNQRYA